MTVSEPRRKALLDANQPIPPNQTIVALVDTGASCTCIDPDVLAPLGLTPTGTTPMHTPSTGTTPATMKQYDVGLAIFGAGPDDPPFFLPTIAVVESELKAQGIEALLGRDILSSCVLIYNGTMNQFTLAF